MNIENFARRASGKTEGLLRSSKIWLARLAGGRAGTTLTEANEANAARAADVMMTLPAAAQERVIRSLYLAVYLFRQTGDTQVLVSFAEDAVATAEAHSIPGYTAASRAAPERPTGTGRPLDEVLSELRR